MKTGLRKSFERLTVKATTRSNFQSCPVKLRFGMQVVLTMMSYQKNFQPNRSNVLGLTAILKSGIEIMRICPIIEWSVIQMADKIRMVI